MYSKYFNFIAMIIFVASIFIVFKVGYQVQKIQQEIALATSQLKQEKETIKVLQAEWSYLNHPEHLAHLSQKYLAMENITGSQISYYDDIYNQEMDIRHLVSGHQLQLAEIVPHLKPVTYVVDAR
ncbi:MAG: hypothetical protein AAF195_03465 [Pseudomonadota bacterium]